MANFISEKEIQEASIKMFLEELQYSEHLYCEYDDRRLGRGGKKEVVSKKRLKKALEEINGHLPEKYKAQLIEEAIKEMTRYRSNSGLAANKEIHQLLKKGFDTFYIDENKQKQKEKVLYIDFYYPLKNHFIVVEELPIKQRGERRPDLILYVNGLPLVYIELKNSNIDVRIAYSKNLQDCKRDIPTLFHYNAFIILSNGIDTKVGSFTASWEHYNEWKRVESESEDYNPEEDGISLERVVKGMCDKKRLLDILRNFIFYFSDNAKIVAKNHQYIGVNNGIASFQKRLEQEGKLGVFWHTQGSGKSFSMIFFTMKVFNQFVGDYTFVIVTDRDSLDDQIFKNFIKAEIIGEKDEVKAQSRAHLKTMLGASNKKYIFTLIQKFGTEKGEEYPLLTERNDIIVLVDEAHRSQYNTFAQNMRTAMPNANYLAFTGTPLLDANETTKEWFGEYISEYNFAQSIEDGATVPLFYENRVPQVQLGNKYLNEDFAQIVDNDNLSEVQEEKLKKRYTTEMEVIKREERLREIAKDIAKHFPYRAYRGKAMVISVDKYTTVQMYDYVKQYLNEEKRALNRAISRAATEAERQEKRDILDFIKQTEMYVVISKEGDEEEKFMKKGLNITPHRKAMDKRYGDKKHTLKDRFQEAKDPFRLVFLCSKWLTGFDSPTISTLYLDKPMQNHTLMQTIARANRVAPDKECGMIIDYFGVFHNLEKALEKYGKKKNKKLKEGDKPVQKKEKLIELLEKALQAMREFLEENDCDMDLILNDAETVFKKIKYFGIFANNLSKTEELQKEYNVHENAIRNLYNATQPDTEVAKKYKRTKEAYEYLRQVINRENKKGNFESAVEETRQLLDESIHSIGYEITPMEEIDLRTVNFEDVEQDFKKTDLKYLAITDFKQFLKDQLERMLSLNPTRIDFAAKMQEIIDRYNSKTSDVEQFFEELKGYAQRLRAEDLRAQSEGLTEQELLIFDLLYKENLTKAQKQTVKLAAKDLLDKLKAEKENVLVVDWHKTQRHEITVERFIKIQLYSHLKEVYDNPTFLEQSEKVYRHLHGEAERGRGLFEAA